MMKGFTAKSWKMRWFPAPEELISEDYFAFDERKGIMAVADGITREKSSYLDDIFSLRLKSKARMAAERAVRAFIISLRCFHNIDERAVKLSAIRANEDVKLLNEFLGINPETVDYLKNDYAGCTFAGGAYNEKDGVVIGAFVADARLGIYRRDKRELELTPNLGPTKELDAQMWADSKMAGKNWGMAEGRRGIRKYFRNKPNGYYALTGEKEAEEGIHVVRWEFKPGDVFCACTDDMGEVVEAKGLDYFIVKDFAGLEEQSQGDIKHEGTIVYCHEPMYKFVGFGK